MGGFLWGFLTEFQQIILRISPTLSSGIPPKISSGIYSRNFWIFLRGVLQKIPAGFFLGIPSGIHQNKCSENSSKDSYWASCKRCKRDAFRFFSLRNPARLSASRTSFWSYFKNSSRNLSRIATKNLWIVSLKLPSGVLRGTLTGVSSKISANELPGMQVIA